MQAREDATERAASASRAPATAAQRGPVTPEARRDPAFYRGRARETSPEEVLAWIPRILFLPMAIVTELVLRRPLVALFAWMERHEVLDAIDYLLNPHPDVSWSPTLSFEVDVLALPGLHVEWRNALVRGHDIEVDFAMGGTDFWRARVRDRWRIGELVVVGVGGGYSTRPERPFYGLGPRSEEPRTYYAETVLDLTGFVALAVDPHVQAELRGGYSLERSAPGIEPSLDARFDVNEVPGLGLYELGIGSVELTLDSRADHDEAGGVRFVGKTLVGVDARDPLRSFLSVELELSAGVEVSHPDRVLGARLYAMNTATFGEAPVPFTRLAWLGWDRHRGFVRGRFRGEAALMAEVRYRYPINYYVDALWFASAGNVFARDGSDFDFGALTGSLGVGFRTRRTGFAPIEMTVALGTSRFEERFEIEGVRFFFETVVGP
ncbi:MAG TPA: hypothetical protein RMH99_29590 [Sandaracinaceae bacterium LLY-WYZ-13_1]|nr:hypothetical protein [Sandaracinaceae bacterium LLY-WYZ-13_1]